MECLLVDCVMRTQSLQFGGGAPPGTWTQEALMPSERSAFDPPCADDVRIASSALTNEAVQVLASKTSHRLTQELSMIPLFVAVPNENTFAKFTTPTISLHHTHRIVRASEIWSSGNKGNAWWTLKLHIKNHAIHTSFLYLRSIL